MSTYDLLSDRRYWTRYNVIFFYICLLICFIGFGTVRKQSQLFQTNLKATL